MNPPDINNELHIAYREPENWLLQASNIMKAILWFLGTWIMATTVTIVFLSILLVLNIDENDIEAARLQDIQPILSNVFIIVSIFVAIILVTIGLPKRLQNVFKDIAHHRIYRYQSIKQDINEQVDITETVLLKHRLITQQDIDSRKAGLAENVAI